MFKYIPILNTQINPGEVVDGINKLDKGKAAGVYSIPPGVLKILPDEWILVIIFLFNLVFLGLYIPISGLSLKFLTSTRRDVALTQASAEESAY